MKLIHKFKSPNFNNRKSSTIIFIIIHYTALRTVAESIKHLCSKKNKVSCHYLISKNGEIYNLVSEKKRAWHAGESYWNGEIDINSKSIGIELDYSYYKENNLFSKKLINSLYKLLNILISKYKILPKNILGHSDIAPYRKKDPGKNFPWHLLQKKKLAFEIKKLNYRKKPKTIIYTWFKINKLNSKKKRILFMLNFIGYDTSKASINNVHYKNLLLAYNNRFRYYKNLNYNYKNIFNVIELHLINILLTK